jgi:hypothetical protein
MLGFGLSLLGVTPFTSAIAQVLFLFAEYILPFSLVSCSSIRFIFGSGKKAAIPDELEYLPTCQGCS